MGITMQTSILEELVVYKDDITYCTLDGVGLVVINR